MSLLQRTSFFIREHVGMLKLVGTYDILDPESKEVIGQAKEEISGGIKALRLLLDKSLLPTTVNIYEGSEGRQTRLVTLKRGAFSLIPKVSIYDRDGKLIGHFKSKMFSIGCTFRIFDANKTEVGLVKGDWTGWNFKLLSNETELGVVTKKWAGVGKELFTTADNYVISLNGQPNEGVAALLLAAGIAIDVVFKEKK